MQRVEVTIEHDDETVDVVVLRPAALVIAERHLNGRLNGMEGTLFAAWHQLGRPAGKFDIWLESVAGAQERAFDPKSESSTAESPSSSSPQG